MKYLLDTNIVLAYVRQSKLTDYLESEYNLFNGLHDLYISIVTLGELDSIVRQFKYGSKKKKRLEEILMNLAVIEIGYQDVIERYGEIDAFSQCKHDEIHSSFSARNMGKNDLWIAATSSLFGLQLITTDKDFEHLNEVFLDLQYVDLEAYKKG